jgi:hypothetical protein
VSDFLQENCSLLSVRSSIYFVCYVCFIAIRTSVELRKITLNMSFFFFLELAASSAYFDGKQ